MKKISILISILIWLFLLGCSPSNGYEIPPHESLRMEFRGEEPNFDTYNYRIDVESYTFDGDNFTICGDYKIVFIGFESGKVHESTETKCETLPLEYLQEVRSSILRYKEEW